jgi:hypothetical protein
MLLIKNALMKPFFDGSWKLRSQCFSFLFVPSKFDLLQNLNLIRIIKISFCLISMSLQMILHGYQLIIAKFLSQFYESFRVFEESLELAEELKVQQLQVLELDLDHFEL